MSVAPNVAELAVSTRVQSEYQNASGDSSTISKPAIVQLSSASRSITSYAVQEGDTVATVAAKYDLSENTIKWANNLNSNTIAVGSTIDILPRDGIAYIVRDGDTIDTIANKYKSDVSTITTYNDLEINGVSTGLKIIIPGGTLPETERPGYVAPRAVVTTGGTYITGYSSGFSNGKTWFIKRGTPNTGSYAFGNCTAYVFDRRAELGIPVGQRWGNAGSWATNARNTPGYTVNRTPSAGAVIQDSGHVAIVEAVLPNGDLQLSEMNARVAGGGFNIVSGRILPASQVSQYYYIH
ncbi:MAG: LysM peptidoglycan-binding domain-containing protein [Candidatus Saccharimonadaceae bacterium]